MPPATPTKLTVKVTAKLMAKPAIKPTTPPANQAIDTSYLESLMGYNARRASLVIIGEFMAQMAVYGLRPVDFSVLSLITHNAGITSRQLCSALGLLPPNLVGMINTLEKRELIQRRPHPSDGRAMGLYLSAKGRKLMRDAEQTAARLEAEVTAKLTPTENKTLIRLLKKIYV
jgi:DNA-binding MarR family transcriptional regulator